MDFEAFLADCRAEWREFDDDAALARAGHPRDRSLRPLLDAVRGMATENKLVLLDRAVAHLAPDEVYVEIGCWHGVYFYDGGHDVDDQFRALQAMLPHLAPDAAVIVDDTNWRHVRAANRFFARHADGFELVRDLRTRSAFSPTWWNGLQVYRWRGRPGAVLATPPDYAARRRFWDGAYLRVARAWWGTRGVLGRVPGARRVWRRLAARAGGA